MVLSLTGFCLRFGTPGRILHSHHTIHPADAKKIPKVFSCEEYVIKAQILTGGRGKGVFKENGFKGGVKLTKDRAEVASLVEKMLGNHLVTHQTGSDGVKVEKVMIAESYNIVQEAYFAIVMDRDMGIPF